MFRHFLIMQSILWMFTSNKLNAYISISVHMQITSCPGLRRDSNSSPTPNLFSQFKSIHVYYPPTVYSRHFPSHQRTLNWAKLHRDYNSEGRKWQNSITHLFNKYLLTTCLAETRFWTRGEQNQLSETPWRG